LGDQTKTTTNLNKNVDAQTENRIRNIHQSTAMLLGVVVGLRVAIRLIVDISFPVS
jgi:cytochrome b